MPARIVKENDLILLILDERKRWLLQARKDEEFHTHRGIVHFNDIIGKPYGTVVFSRPLETQGYKFYVLEPLPSDLAVLLRRKTQIIYPEDAGLIIVYSGISPGSNIIEAGCGSGALTCLLANQVRPNGHVYSYDVKEKNIKRARKNVEKAKLDEFVTIQKANIIEEDLDLEPKNVDAIILDMPQPWLAIKKVKKYLKLSGVLASFSPTIEQVKKTTFALEDCDFCDIKTYELLKRTYQVKQNATRPHMRMIGHTGYITFGRKIKQEENIYRSKKPLESEKFSMNGMPKIDGN